MNKKKFIFYFYLFSFYFLIFIAFAAVDAEVAYILNTFSFLI